MMFGKKKGYAVKWTSDQHPRGGQTQVGFKTKQNAEDWLDKFADKGPESGVRGKVVRENIHKFIERVLMAEADPVNETPEEYAKDYLPGGIWYGMDYSWEDIIEEVNSYFDRDFPVTEKIFKDLTGVTPAEYDRMIEVAKQKEKIDEQIDDLEWDISSLEYFLEDKNVRLEESHDAIFELITSLKRQLEDLQEQKKALDA